MMNQAVTEDKGKAEELLKKYFKMQETLAIQGTIAAKRATVLEESCLLQEWLEAQAEAMKSFSGGQLPASLEGGFTGGAAESAKEALMSIARPALVSPII